MVKVQYEKISNLIVLKNSNKFHSNQQKSVDICKCYKLRNYFYSRQMFRSLNKYLKELYIKHF